MEAVSELVRTLLSNRGVSDTEIRAFLEPDYDIQTHSPFLLDGMDRAIARVLDAISSGERIAIYADFDCDGTPGAALLYDAFVKIGYENIEVYLPHRDREGYGFHKDAIDALAARKVSLIITIDVGTTAVDSVAHAKKIDIDVIVTDHHELPPTLPDAFAILNPKLGNYPFRDLCGAATAFKLVQALLIEGRKRGLPAFLAIPEGWEKWLLDMVAVATIADMVPLVGENRVLARFGLSVLRKSPRLGIRALCTRARIPQSDLTEDDIGFTIAPRINAASRMDEPELAFRLLTTRSADEAETLAAQLEQLNTKRKTAVGVVVREARRRARDRFTKEERVVVLGNPQWKPALLGLAANSVVEDRGGIACLWGRDANGNLKGSCRSDGSISIVEMFSNTTDALSEHGGHAYSGGFSVSHEKVHTLSDALNEAATKSGAAVVEKREPDMNIGLQAATSALHRDFSSLSPFGTGNPKPLFSISRVIVTSVRRFGKENNHMEMMVICRDTGARARTFQFFAKPEDFTLPPVPQQEVRILATLERDSFRGPHAVVLRLVDILSPQS